MKTAQDLTPLQRDSGEFDEENQTLWLHEPLADVFATAHSKRGCIEKSKRVDAITAGFVSAFSIVRRVATLLFQPHMSASKLVRHFAVSFKAFATASGRPVKRIKGR